MTKDVWQNHWLHLILLSALVWVVFSRTLGSYFLADDFGEIFYVSRICNGEYNLLWLNFSSNFMSVPGMSVWRPWLLVSLLIDFLVWKANPIGFYLTNVLSYNATVVLLYCLMRMLTRSATRARSCLTAFVTASLFAVSPLHCESVSWVVGRVDVVCAVFYLLCLCLFIQADRASSLTDKRRYRMLVMGYLACFWISIWTKEMTIGAPLLAPTLIFLFGSKPLDLKNACKISAPLWLSTVLYFVLRYLALGTLLGGYTQGIGDTQAASALSHWLDGDTLHRLLFPFANGIYGPQPGLAPLLGVCYLIIITVISIRAISLKLDCKWLLVLLVWIATCLAPLYKLWGLGYELEGARFCFFLTMPLAALVPSLLLIDSKASNYLKVSQLDRSLTLIGLLATTLACGILAKTATRTNLEWVHAGKEVREFLRQTGDLNQRLSTTNQQMVLLGIPKRRGGAHMILNGSTFRKALRPPFTNTDLTSQIHTFDPVFFSENFKLDVSRFKRTTNGNSLIAYWDDKEGKLKQQLLLPAQSSLPTLTINNYYNKQGVAFVHSIGRADVQSSDHTGLTLTNIQEGDGISFSQLQLNPLSADILEAEITVFDYPQNLKELTFSANFNELDSRCQIKTTKTIIDNLRQPFLINIPLSQNWRWFTTNKLNSVSLQLPPGTTAKIGKARLINAEHIKPTITAPAYQQSNDGHYFIPSSEDAIEIHIALPELERIAKASVFITAKNAFFDIFKNPHDAVEFTLALPIKPGQHTFSLDTKAIKSDSYRQISVQLLDKDGKAVGGESDAIMIQFKD